MTIATSHLRRKACSTWLPWLVLVESLMQDAPRPPFGLRRLLPHSGVVVAGQLVGHRETLASEHVTVGQLVVLQRVVAAHVYLAGHDLGPAGAADPALAGVGQVGACLLG